MQNSWIWIATKICLLPTPHPSKNSISLFVTCEHTKSIFRNFGNILFRKYNNTDMDTDTYTQLDNQPPPRQGQLITICSVEVMLQFHNLLCVRQSAARVATQRGAQLTRPALGLPECPSVWPSRGSPSPLVLPAYT